MIALAAAASTTPTTTDFGHTPEGQAVGWVIVLLGLAVVASMVIWPVWHGADVRRGVARWRASDVISVLPPISALRVLNRLSNHRHVKPS